jgi:hypothetical protein
LSASPNEDVTGELGQFFNYLWGEQEGFVYLPVKDQKTSDWKKVMFEWPKHKEQVIVHTLANSAEGKDVYCAPVIFDSPRPIKENVKGSYVLWADFDGNAPGSWSEQNLDTGSGPPVASVPPPTLRVQSSVEGHEHIFWRLDKFATDVKFIEDSNRSIAYTYRADTSGWDVNQVLRPPGTVNHKPDRNKEVVTIVEENNASYSRESFNTLKPVKQLVSEALDVADIPDVTWVVSKYSWDEDHYQLFMQKTIEEGKRSSALMKIGFFGAECGMSDAEIFSLLINADDRWGKFKHRTDRKKRLLDIINKARQKHPTGLSTPEGLLRSATDVDVETSIKYLYGFQEFLDTDITIEWAFENLLEVGGIGVLSALPGVGKTQMSIQLGIAAALGIPFLKWTPTRKMKVLCLSLEMAHAPFKYFVANIAQNYTPSDREVLDRNFKIVPLGEPLPFDKPEGKKFLEAIIEEYKPDGIIIDSMGKVTNASLTDEAKIKELNAYYVRLRNKFGCWLWFIHHNRKPNGDNKKPTELSDLYGNQYIAAETTVVLNLWRYKDTKKLEVSQIKSRLSPECDPFEVTRNEHLTFSVTGKKDTEMVDNLLSHISNEKEVKKNDSDGDRPIFGF